MKKLSKTQQVQEKQYGFPYHHIPQFDGQKFSQTRTLRWGYEYASYILRILDELEYLHPDSILDIGCGDGAFLAQARTRFPRENVAGVDYSPRAVAFARAFNPGVTVYADDITNPKTELAEHQYSAITLIETLEHIPPKEIDLFLHSIHRLLKKGGVFICTVPSTNIPVSEKHYQHFNIQALEIVLGSYFEVKTFIYLNKKGVLPKILQILLTNRLWAINSYRLNKIFFTVYQRFLARAHPHNGKRLLVVCSKK